MAANNIEGRLYLTLCGAAGRDLEMLIDSGIISRTETGSLTPDSAELVAAIENSGPAIAQLYKKFPGLKVHGSSYEHLLHGSSPTKFPLGNEEKLCRSAVVNLDLNSPLASEIVTGNISFPIVDYLHKLSTIHTAQNKLEWCLLLTLHGELLWNEQTWQFMTNYLLENLNAVPAFRTAAVSVFGADTVALVDAGDSTALANAKDKHQRLLLGLLPKLIADKVRDQRWAIHVDWCFAYGGGGKSAPMGTWAIEFRHSDAQVTPTVMYTQNIGRILANAGLIDGTGKAAMLANH